MSAPKDIRVPLMISSGELAAIDTWRYAHQVPNRSEAIRRLCYAGIIVTTPGVMSAISKATPSPSDALGE